MTKNKNKKQQQTKKQTKQRVKTKTIYVEKPLSIGAQIGDSLQKFGTNLFTKFMGTGDYVCNDGAMTVNSNSLIKGSTNKAVKMNSSGSSFIFEHSEYIGDVYSSSTAGAFLQNTFTVNPANQITFPWLSQLATSFETYEVDGLMFRFVSTSGESVASTNTALGSIMGTFQYDSLDLPFKSKQQLLQYDDTVDGKISQNFLVGVECDKSKIPTFSNKLYIGTPPLGADAKTYNYGNFVVASQGVPQASQNLGEVWVSYRIRLHVTKDSDYSGGSYRFESLGASTTSLGSVSISSGSLPATISTNSITCSNMQVGCIYELVMYAQTASPGNWNMNMTTGVTGATNFNFLNGGTAYYSVSGLATTSAVLAVRYIQATSQTVNILNPITGSPSTFVYDFVITQLDGSIVA